MIKIAVLGDVVWDRLRMGKKAQPNPEAPDTLAISESECKEDLGGAANLAAWIAAQEDFQVDLYAHFSPDEAGRKFIKRCEQRDVRLLNCLFRHRDVTTTKERILHLVSSKSKSKSSKLQVKHLVRIDRDTKAVLNEYERLLLQERLAYGEYQAIVLVDYGKGVFVGEEGDKLRKHFGGSDRPRTFVNSKFPHLWSRNEIDFLICNEKEKKSSWAELSLEEAHQRTKAEYLVVTRGKDGVELRGANQGIAQQSLVTECVDVTGAGDSFTAGVVVEYLRWESLWSIYGRVSTAGLMSVLQRGQEFAEHSCKQIGCGEPLRI